MGVIDLFIQRDEPKAGSSQAKAEEPVGVSAKVFKKATAKAAAEPTPSAYQAEVSAAPSEEVMNRIWDVIIAKNLPGPDYLELKNNAAALDDMPLSEEQKLEASYKVIKKQHPKFSKEMILGSIDTYIGIVNEEKENGRKQCEELRQNTVGEKEARHKQLMESVEGIRKQIEEYQRQLAETTAAVNNIEHEILTAKQEIDAKEQAFTSSINTVIAAFQADKVKIASLNIE